MKKKTHPRRKTHRARLRRVALSILGTSLVGLTGCGAWQTVKSMAGSVVGFGKNVVRAGRPTPTGPSSGPFGPTSTTSTKSKPSTRPSPTQGRYSTSTGAVTANRSAYGPLGILGKKR